MRLDRAGRNMHCNNTRHNSGGKAAPHSMKEIKFSAPVSDGRKELAQAKIKQKLAERELKVDKFRIFV